MSKITELLRFRKDYESSSLPLAVYGKLVGMSASMVHYYLKKSKTATSADRTVGLKQILIAADSTDKVVKITTSSGIVIEAPI